MIESNNNGCGYSVSDRSGALSREARLKSESMGRISRWKRARTRDRVCGVSIDGCSRYPLAGVEIDNPAFILGASAFTSLRQPT